MPLVNYFEEYKTADEETFETPPWWKRPIWGIRNWFAIRAVNRKIKESQGLPKPPEGEIEAVDPREMKRGA